MIHFHNGKILKNIFFSKLKKNMGKEAKKIEVTKRKKKKLIDATTIVYKKNTNESSDYPRN